MALPGAFDRLKDAVLLVPGIHILICFIYLFSYYSSFGSGIAYFSSPADVFSVSMQEVAPSYISLLTGVALAYLLFLDPHRGNVYYQDTLPEEQREAFAASRKLRVAKTLFVSTIIVLALVQAAYWWRAGAPEYNLLHTLTQLLVVAGSLWIGTRFSLGKSKSDLVMIGGLMVSAVIIAGVKDGHYDRSVSYSDYRGAHPRCGTAIVIRNIASRYLAVMPDNRRVLITEECQIRIELRRATDFRPLPRKTPFQVIMTGVP